MNYTPTFGTHPLGAWSASLTCSAKRMVALFLAGGLGNLIGTLPSMDLHRLPFAFFSVIGYPLVLVQNLTSIAGIFTSGTFLVLLGLAILTSFRLTHACAIAILTQSLFTFLSGTDHHFSSWATYLALTSPLLGVYVLFLLDYLRTTRHPSEA